MPSNAQEKRTAFFANALEKQKAPLRCFETVEKAGWTAHHKLQDKKSLSGYEIHCKIALYKKVTEKAEKPHNSAVFALFVFCSGAVPRGSPKSHMAFWGEEKCTL
ncbi:MAG: hypothetical protein KH282_07405, partial [Clostridiales bacterium]|nr:hypothetical protein [Clostridiales bacterium]